MMKVKMRLVFFVVVLLVPAVNCKQVQILEDLRLFIGTLEQFALTPNEVVFLLDESGSIGAERYKEVKLFTELVVHRLSVSAEHSRVALVSFADLPRTHVNYIKNSNGKNMCTLLKSIHDLDYVGSGTATSLAMESAREIFVQARPNSNKIIVLLTDGQSNSGYSPVDAAIRLKQNGVIIFSVGVADVNVDEINAVSSSKNHIYILKNFDYIKDVNEYLNEESKSDSWDLANDIQLCNSICSNRTDCCDDHANCYCGTREGRYQCACNAGYQGKSGLRGECRVCPKGTYKSKEGNDDCLSCPSHSSTKREGSTSSNDCTCETGYEMHGNYCKPIECSKLQVPDGGIIIPTNCSNLYGTQCTLKCKEGYCPHSCNFAETDKTPKTLPWNNLPLPSRNCLETGNWSGEDFHCERIRCPVLDHPYYGNHNCSGSNFVFGTTCHFGCESGYELSGSNLRTCLSDSTWTGTQTHCTEIYCNPLKMNQNLQVKPGFCSKKKMPYRSVCQYYCAKGYSLTSQFGKSDGKNECLDNKTWSGADLKISCADISPPSIKCPQSITRTTDPSKETSMFKWREPIAEDNVFVSDIAIKFPLSIRKPPYAFPIGITKILYEAYDSSNNSNTCSFSVEVQDKEKPKVLFCPDDIEVYNEHNSLVQVNWTEPMFSDNSGILNPLISNRKSGDKFSWGPANVIFYNVSDPSGNTASCSFTVKIKQYPCPSFEPPENGMVACDKWQDGRLCSVFCNEGYQFASNFKVPSTYECNPKGSSFTQESKWLPFPYSRKTKFKFPVPDCSRKQRRNAVNLTLEIDYAVDLCNDEVLEKTRKKFINTLMPLDRLFKGMICPVNKGCKPENVNISCGTSHSKHKRSVDLTHSKNSLKISFNIELYPSKDEDVSEFESEVLTSTETSVNQQDLVLTEIELLISKNVREVYNITSLPAPQHFNYNVASICSMGQISINNSCVNCPAGTFKDDRIDDCADCPSATFQELENSLTCSPCPKDHTTYQTRSKSSSDCKAPCQPGTYSRTTFEPCLSCPLNTYQNNLGSKECLKCPTELLTWRIGSNSSNDCASPCTPGSYSDTGLKPCTLCDVGTYQNSSQQKVCKICPSGTSTTHGGSTTLSQCKEIDMCKELHPCSNSSTCVPLGNSYKCVCGYGSYGKQCEIFSDFCDTDTCFNNGTCISTSDGNICICPVGFSGFFCEININDCDKGYCHNGGECIDLVNGYACNCQDGYSGPKCEVNIYDCASEPCLNGGTCFDKINGYKCCCPTEYIGLNCEKKQDPCERIKCENDGVCMSNKTMTVCICKPGFQGEYCEINIDDCFNYTCFNNGSCIDGVDQAVCKCPLLYTGSHCEEGSVSEYLLSFQIPLTSNYVELKNTQLLYAITVSFFMRTSYRDSQSRPTPISYSYYDKKNNVLVDNALTLFDLNRIVLYLHGETLHTGYVANSDSNWHHYAVTWESNNGKWSFFVDGNVFVSGTHIGENKYMWPGIFIIGQEQDSLGGSFSISEAFVGDVSEFNVWDYALSEEEITSISSSCGIVGNLIPWFVATRHSHGTVSISKDVNLCKDIGSCSDSDCFCFYSTDATVKHCKNSVQHCNPSPCKNEQPCVLNGSKAYCNCSIGYDGKFCEYDLNECLENNGGCAHKCVNTIGSYYCECPDGMRLSDNGFACKDTGFCEVGEQVFMDGESWISDCQSCLCDQGNVNCLKLECNISKCYSEENLIHLPGECCPKCIPYSFCFASPNHTLSTFDYSHIEFSKDCDFTMVEDCVNGLFSVRLESIKNQTLGNNLLIYQDCSKVQVSAAGELLVNDDSVVLPFKNDLFNMIPNNESIDIWSRSGLYVQWHASGEILVAVPADRINYMCGICGNFQEYNMMKNSEYMHTEGSPLVNKGCLIRPEVYQDNIHVAKSHQLPLFTTRYPLHLCTIFIIFHILISFCFLHL